MNGKEPIKVRLSTVILLFVIFVLILALIFMYFYFSDSKNMKTTKIDSNINDKSINNSSINSNIIESSKPQDNISNTISLNIESQEIEQLYKYIMKVNTNQEDLVYKNRIVTEKDLNNQLKLITVFENIDKNDAIETKSITDEYGFSTEHTYYSKQTIENMAKKIFGDNVSISHESCEAYFTQARDYNNGVYDCFEYQGGGDTPWELSTCEIIKAEQNDDEIYIYDKYVHVYRDAAETTCDIYDSSDKSLKVAENVSFDDIVKNAISDSGTYSSKKIISNLENITNNKIKTFKHTFKKNSNGLYYWYSTQPVE